MEKNEENESVVEERGTVMMPVKQKVLDELCKHRAIAMTSHGIQALNEKELFDIISKNEIGITQEAFGKILNEMATEEFIELGSPMYNAVDGSEPKLIKPREMTLREKGWNYCDKIAGFEKDKKVIEQIKFVCESCETTGQDSQRKIFISFCDNFEFVLKLCNSLIQNGYSPVVYPARPDFGVNVDGNITDRIDKSNNFIFIIGSRTKDTHYVDNEIGYAFALTKNGIKPPSFVIPIIDKALHIEYRGFFSNNISNLLEENNHNTVISDIIRFLKREPDILPKKIDNDTEKKIEDKIKEQLNIESPLTMKIIISKKIEEKDISRFVHWALDRHTEATDAIFTKNIPATPSNPLMLTNMYFRKTDTGEILGEIFFWVQHREQMASGSSFRLRIEIEWYVPS